MSQTRCNQYKHLCIRHQAIQKDSKKFRASKLLFIQSLRLLPSRDVSNIDSHCVQLVVQNNVTTTTTTNNNNRNNTNRKQKSIKSSSVDDGDLQRRIFNLREYCEKIQTTFKMIREENYNLEQHGNHQLVVVNHPNNNMEKAKETCKKLLDVYEKEYDNLRGMCNAMVEMLESKMEQMHLSLFGGEI